MNRLTDESLSKAEKRQTIDERIAMWDDPEWDEEGYGQPLRYPDEDLVYSLLSPPPSPSDIFSRDSDFSYMSSSLDSQEIYPHYDDQIPPPFNKDDSNDELSNDNPFLKLDKQYRENSKDNQQEIQTVKKGEENIKYDVKKQFEHDEEYGHAVPEHRIYCRHIDNQIFKAPRQSIDNPSLKKRRLVATQLYC